MSFAIFSGLSIIIALFAVYYGAKLLKNISWVFGWLRGTAGICLLLFAGALIVSSLDLLSYKRVIADRSIATLSISKVSDQIFSATVIYTGESEEEIFEIAGDQWQMDAKIIRWQGLLLAMGAKPGYRLDRISGRYLSLEDERRKQRTVYQLNDSQLIDTWNIIHDHGKFVPWVDAVYGSATYLPLADGAIYEVSLTSSGLAAVPLNDAAKKALDQFL